VILNVISLTGTSPTLIAYLEQIHCITYKGDNEFGTRCLAITERLRCRVRYRPSFRQKWKTGTGRQYFTDIIGLSSTTVI